MSSTADVHVQASLTNSGDLISFFPEHHSSIHFSPILQSDGIVMRRDEMDSTAWKDQSCRPLQP